MTNLQTQLTQLPKSPGVYLFRDKNNKIIYIGKAKVLKNRVRSYFQKNDKREAKIRVMVPLITNIEWIVVRNEVEAILTEANLIKEKRPRFNVLMKDDKSFPYIQITNEPYPRIEIIRKQKLTKDKNIYFGPYTDVGYLRKILKVIHKIFQLRTCSYYIDENSIIAGNIKICLDYHLKLCGGPCEGLVNQEEYGGMIRQIIQFMKGRNGDIRKYISCKMDAASADLDFESAAQYRNQLTAIDRFTKRQKKVMNDFTDRDVLAVSAENKYGIGVVMRIRNGLLIGREKFHLTVSDAEDRKQVLAEYFTQYYNSTDDIPTEILVESDFPGKDGCETWLKDKLGKSVKIRIPEIGEKKTLVGMAVKNADLLVGELRIRKTRQKEIVPKKVQFLQEDLNMEIPPRRIEAFDISNIQGTNSVASMVCFIDGKPRKKEYRKYNIKTVTGIDDFESMNEVINRRYTRVLIDNLPLPDLILIDGGKGQLNSATRALNKLGLNYIPTIGLAKRLEEVFKPGIGEPQNIPKNSHGLYLLREIRDEAHRFAVTFHRQKRKKEMTKSVLDDIPGMGPKRINAVWKAFKSIDELKSAAPNEIQSKSKIPQKIAEAIVSHLIK